MELWYWASLMFLFMPIISIAKIPRILEMFGDCMKGKIRFMTAVTLAYAHAYQATCLTRHMPLIPAPKLPAAQARSQISASSKCSLHNTCKRQ